MVCRRGPHKVPRYAIQVPPYAVEGFSAGGATVMPRHVAKRDKSVHPLRIVGHPTLLSMLLRMRPRFRQAHTIYVGGGDVEGMVPIFRLQPNSNHSKKLNHVRHSTELD